MLKSTFSGVLLRRYLHSFSCCCLPNQWNPTQFSEKIRTYSSSRSCKVINLVANRKSLP